MRAGAALVGGVTRSEGKAPLRTSLRELTPPRASVKMSFGCAFRFGSSDGMRAAGSVISGRREFSTSVGRAARFKSLMRVGTMPETSVKMSFGSAPKLGGSVGIEAAGSVNPGRRELNISVESARFKSLIKVGMVPRRPVETGRPLLRRSLTK